MHFVMKRSLAPVVPVTLAIAFVAMCPMNSIAAAPHGKGKTSGELAANDAPATTHVSLGTAGVQLLRDPLVQSELGISPSQRSVLDSAYAKIEQPLWLSRDFTTGPRAEERTRLGNELEAAMSGVLEPNQQTRLRQISLQAEGWPALATAEVGKELKLSAEQTHRIEQVLASTQDKVRQVAASSATSTDREKSLLDLRTDQGVAIQKMLSPKQRQKLAELVGERYDVSQVAPLTYHAPELKAVDDWINSRPLRLVDLRGKVVAVHFWAFGCINCVHNLPHYNKWHDEFAAQGLVVLGLHTPETAAERDLPSLRKAIAQREIRYPVAVDHNNENWAAWANSMWPSVYLIDRQGRVRYWWYGEMNWQGAEGEKFMREKISQLLAETM